MKLLDVLFEDLGITARELVAALIAAPIVVLAIGGLYAGVLVIAEALQ